MPAVPPSPHFQHASWQVFQLDNFASHFHMGAPIWQRVFAWLWLCQWNYPVRYRKKTWIDLSETPCGSILSFSASVNWAIKMPNVRLSQKSRRHEVKGLSSCSHVPSTHIYMMVSYAEISGYASPPHWPCSHKPQRCTQPVNRASLRLHQCIQVYSHISAMCYIH